MVMGRLDPSHNTAQIPVGTFSWLTAQIPVGSFSQTTAQISVGTFTRNTAQIPASLMPAGRPAPVIIFRRPQGCWPYPKPRQTGM